MFDTLDMCSSEVSNCEWLVRSQRAKKNYVIL